VGRFAPVKRLEVFLELASRCPELAFDIAGAGDRSQPYVQDLESTTSTLPNVSRHGPVFGADLHALYAQANLLVCTSAWEGLPNVFLEAWARGLPVVSTIDPDGMIAKNGLGAVVADTNDLAIAVRQLLENPGLEEISRRVREFYLANYTVDVTVAAFEALFTRVSEQSRTAPSTRAADDGR
jgi:glycosyltransferase involved in cell wall biosynthesis